jgi:outer membrane protein OmpA-like peptidoglycan-associated protein
LELFGSAPVQEAAGASEPLEGHAGLRWFAPAGPVFTLGAGRGLVAGRGAPDFRTSLGIAWDPRPDPTPKKVEPPPPQDTDGDGLLDPDDKCPQEPEDKDGFEDEDGCPDPDNDQDKILDAADKCPLKAEDIDTFEDADGCPDPDNDQDKILDSADKCPLEAEDPDGFQDLDGCPDPDNDHDGILDAGDKCPTDPEVYNEFEDDDGCPDKGQQAKVVVTRSRVEILEKVYFNLNRARIKRSSYEVLNQVAAVLKSNAGIVMMRVEGHTDRHGSVAYNQRLSAMRAKAVRKYLVKRGVPKDRLVSEGYGFTRPLRNEETEEADAANRRVEFVIVDQNKK